MPLYYNYSRRIASVVNIGGVALGGSNPVLVQSMTNTPTMDTDATVAQCIRTIDKGADFMRVTTPGIRDAENLVHIQKKLQQAGYQHPLVADVHFNAAVAEVAARIVSKVRINPGNYIDKKLPGNIALATSAYQFELERIHERVLPLLKICKEYGTAIRIGVNHGSLSDRIINRYGDTPEGMVESAMEFLRIFGKEGFHQTVVSMKSSNTRVMVYATRMLVDRMLEEGMNYPVHLGVTEAGEGEDGIIKSAVGIGTLLTDGIGDTIRVSLTGDPEQEIPVAGEIVNYFSSRTGHNTIMQEHSLNINPYGYQRRNSNKAGKIGGSQIPKVVLSFDDSDDSENAKKIVSPDDLLISDSTTASLYKNITDSTFISDETDGDKGFILSTKHVHFAGQIRNLLCGLDQLKNNNPVIIHRKYQEKDLNLLQIRAACDFGPLLIDGFADAIWIENKGSGICNTDIYLLSLNLLQASRLRMSKTEYISCPSCGRTLFDLSATTFKIRERTSHLKHLKIGIMGCIVNGPGEMADADYGYVGSGPNKITLYKNKTVVKRNIPESNAVDELIALIKENGDWK